MVNLELYRVFYIVAKCGSLTKAADELFISQPAVSQAIKQLEGQLGMPLFNRTHRGMELSEQGGKQIFPIVEQAPAELDGANDLQVFVHVIMPVTLPMMVSIWLMSFTSKWNDWASSLLYLGANNQKLWTLQYVLKQMIADMQALFGSSSSGSVSDAPLISAKNAGIVVSVIPLIVVCPLVQRFYISGVMAGSIKG